MEPFDSLPVSVLHAPALAPHPTTSPQDGNVVSLLLDEAVAEILPDSDSSVASVLITIVWPAVDKPLAALRCTARGTLASDGAMEGVLLSEPGGVLVHQRSSAGGEDNFVVEWTVEAEDLLLPPLTLVLRLQRLNDASSGQLVVDTLDFVPVAS